MLAINLGMLAINAGRNGDNHGDNLALYETYVEPQSTNSVTVTTT